MSEPINQNYIWNVVFIMYWEMHGLDHKLSQYPIFHTKKETYIVFKCWFPLICNIITWWRSKARWRSFNFVSNIKFSLVNRTRMIISVHTLQHVGQCMDHSRTVMKMHFTWMDIYPTYVLQGMINSVLWLLRVWNAMVGFQTQASFSIFSPPMELIG